ncbi:MAG TPA: TolC family protein, partial [Allocoleopsis sp.]
MHSSNPLIAVGISAVIAIGSAATDSAKAVTPPRSNSPANATSQPNSTNQAPPTSQSATTTQPRPSLLRQPEASVAEVSKLLQSLNRVERVQVLAQASGSESGNSASDASSTDASSSSELDQLIDVLDMDGTAPADNSGSSNAVQESGADETVTPEDQSPDRQTQQNNQPESQGDQPEEGTQGDQPESQGDQPEDQTVESDTPASDSTSTESESVEVESSPSDLPPQDQPEQQDIPERPETVPTSSSNSSESTLEYLDPNPNPLFFPTDPAEVEVVGTQPITLQQAIQLAIRNNEQLQQVRLQVEQAQAALREAEAANYPNVNANANVNFQSQQNPNVVPTLTGGSEVDGTTTQSTTVLGGALQVSYDIFTSGRRSSLVESAALQVRSQQLQLETATEDLILQIAQSYYDVQQADEQAKISRAALEESQQSLRDAQALERAGVGTRFDVLQAQVDVANAQQDLRNQQSQQDITRRRLAQQLNLSQSANVSPAEPVEVAGVWDLSLEQTIVEAYKNRSELEQQLVQRDIAEQNRQAALAQLGPQVSVSASYGLSNTLASDPTTASDDLGFLSNFQAQLGVSLLLFDGGRARAQARQQEANIGIAEDQFANLRDQIRFEVEQAYSQLQASFENIQTTALAVQQAEEALRLARLRFQAGVGTQTDVLRSQTELSRSRFNNLNAILNYNRALVQLQRSVSNLPAGY